MLHVLEVRLLLLLWCLLCKTGVLSLQGLWKQTQFPRFWGRMDGEENRKLGRFVRLRLRLRCSGVKSEDRCRRVEEEMAADRPLSEWNDQ